MNNKAIRNDNMRRLFYILAACLVCGMANAIPAKRLTKTITLANGEKVEATFMGDEHVHFYQDAEGRTYQSGEDGTIAEVSTESLKARWAEKLDAHNQRRLTRAKRKTTGWGAERSPISGERKGLVILVNFSNANMKYTNSDFNDFFNKKGYTQDGFGGSVSEYFNDVSYGKFQLNFDVVGPYKLSKTMAYYGSNNSYGDDKHPAEMVAEAVKLADADVDFSNYDWDKDGEVEQVFVVYAGYGEAGSDIKETIWPHEWELSSAAKAKDGPGALTLDGVTIDTYACSCELNGESGGKMDGIGTACHEFSHCLCIPDMYDTAGKSFGMDRWDLMDYGGYNGQNDNGRCPISYTSYERMYCGWLTPTELTDPTVVSSMPAITDEPVAYIIYNSGNSNEYYMLENRQKNGWDKYIRGHGMMILHVDFDSDVWADNSVNSVASHQRMTIIPADGSLKNSYDSDLAGDPWPGTSKNTELTDTSTPAATLYNSNADGVKKMGHSITEIQETNGLIGFCFDGGYFLNVPTGLDATDITATGFTARWDDVEGADRYQVQLMKKTTVSVQTDTSSVAKKITDKTDDTKVTRAADAAAIYDIYESEDSKYTFTGLDFKNSYSFRVRAAKGELFGEWSEYYKVNAETGINGVAAQSSESGTVYDLMGRAVAKPTKGIYIMDGKKVLVK